MELQWINHGREVLWGRAQAAETQNVLPRLHTHLNRFLNISIVFLFEVFCKLPFYLSRRFQNTVTQLLFCDTDAVFFNILLYQPTRTPLDQGIAIACVCESRPMVAFWPLNLTWNFVIHSSYFTNAHCNLIEVLLAFDFWHLLKINRRARPKTTISQLIWFLPALSEEFLIIWF